MISLTEKNGITFDIEPERITSVKNLTYVGNESASEITIDYVDKVVVSESFFDVINLMTKALMTEYDR